MSERVPPPEPPEPAPGPAVPTGTTTPDDEPVVPDRSDDDRDRGWGEDAGGRDDDERFLRDRPPHW